MGGVLAELGKKLAEKWLSLLVLPGLLYLGAVVVGWTLGHGRAIDIGRIGQQLDTWIHVGVVAPSGLVSLLVAALLASAGIGVAAHALGSLTERVWLAEDWRAWPWPLRPLARARTASRMRRWAAARAAYQRWLDAKSEGLAADRTCGEGAVEEDNAASWRAMRRIALEKPDRPTWIGDRIHSVVVRLNRDSQLDLTTIWPHLWIWMPEASRAEITTARESVSRATTLIGWGLLYLVLGCLWWPSLLIAMVVLGTGWRRARAAADEYALLVEASARLYTVGLAQAVGLDHSGPLDRRTGFALTCLLQGQGYLIPLTDIPPSDSDERDSRRNR